MAGVSGMVAVATVALMMTMMADHVVARPEKLQDSTCNTTDKYVYPYWSYCDEPAQLTRKYEYESRGIGKFLGGLEPEYDESNSTYYVRWTGDPQNLGATYVATEASDESGTLLVNSTVYIYNYESRRVLQWRQEGTDEYFLIEKEVSELTDGARFQFLQATDVTLPCPPLYTRPQCQAYNLVSYPDNSTDVTSGLLTYLEEGVTYIQAAPAGSIGDLPFALITNSSTATPLPIIRTVANQ